MKRRIRTNRKWRAKFSLTLASLSLVISPITVWPQATTAPRVRVDLKETKLRNGLRLITVEDHHAPVISLGLTYNVGSRNERKGRTGFAHLFEHMMFRGTKNVKAEDYFNLVLNKGGAMDASTGSDRTFYYETVPANELELPLFLESDRMRGLSITKTVLDTERNVVQEERRLRIDNQPYGKSRERLNEMLYDNFAYQHQGIGSMEDLNAASVADVQEFFRTYYAPNNAVLVLVGDFSTAEAVAKVKKYFEDIPRQPDPPVVDMSECSEDSLLNGSARGPRN